MNIVFPDPIDLDEEAKQKLGAIGAVHHNTIPESEDKIVERCADAELITANYIDITPSIIDRLPVLKYIVIPAVGYEWVDVEYAKSKGITCLNCPTHNSQAVAELALGLLFSLNRKLSLAVTSLKSGKWDYDQFEGVEFAGKKAGLIGYGNVGKRIEGMSKALGAEVSFVNSKSSNQEVDALVSEVDVLFVCAPLNSKTQNMLDKRRLALLKKTSVIVNVGRGAIIDQQELHRILKDGSIRGAALDVFDGEPLTGEPSEEIIALARLDNVVATPHIGYHTQETASRLGEELLANIQSCIDGVPINRL